jgi:hypothetical protein
MSSLDLSHAPVRSTLRSTAVLALALAMTGGVLVLASSVVGTWS